MKYALVDPSNTVIQTGIKLTPGMRLPDGHRWVRDPDLEFDAETHDAVPDSVPEGASEITYTITPKADAVLLSVLMERAEAALRARMDEEAVARGYDDLRAALSYVGDPNPAWDAQAQAFRDWRSAMWSYHFSAWNGLTAVSEAPTTEDYIAGMPALLLP